MAFRKRRSGDADDGWNLLGQIFDFHFKPHNPTEPFGPMAIMEGKRSMIPDDLTDDQLEALKNTLDGIEVSEYRARVADTLWLRRHDPDAARIAVDAYLESATLLEDPHHWTASMERYERAVRLARQIEPKGDLPQKILAHLETRVRHYDGNDPLYFTCKAVELLEEFRFGQRSQAGLRAKLVLMVIFVGREVTTIFRRSYIVEQKPPMRRKQRRCHLLNASLKRLRHVKRRALLWPHIIFGRTQ